MHYATEDEILGLLLTWKMVERDDARVCLVFWVFGSAVYPAFSQLLLHPALVAGLRASVGVAEVELDASDGAGLLPVWRVVPCELGVVAHALAVGAIDLVADGGDVGLNVCRGDARRGQALGLDFLFNLVIQSSPLLVY